MLQPFPGFCGPSYPATSEFLESSRTVNFYLERIESGLGKDQYALLPTPGTLRWTYVGNINAIRGMLLTPDGSGVGNGKLFLVAGDTPYRVNSAGVQFGAGSTYVLNDNLPVSMGANAA